MSLDPRVKEERGKLAAVIRKDVHRILTASQRAILIEMVNAWYAHRGFEGYIHPGKTRLAKRCGVSARTAKYALSRLRDLKFIVAVANLSGRNEHGANAPTYYTVSLRRIYMEMASARQVKAMLAAEEIGGRGAIFGYTGATPSPRWGGKNCPQYITPLRLKIPGLETSLKQAKPCHLERLIFPARKKQGLR
jgi:hypothetical protein